MLPQNETTVEVTMDSAFFDRLTRRFAIASSRRSVGGALLGAAVGLLSLDEADAAPCPKGKKRCRKKCIPKKHCCRNANCRPAVTGRMCRNGRCVCPPARPKICGGRCIPRADCCPACPAGQACRTGACCFATSEALRVALEPGGPAVIRLCPNTTYQGTFTIGRDVTMIGAGAASTILDGGGSGSVVTVMGDVAAELHGVGIANGNASNAGGGIVVNVGASLTLTASDVSANRAIGGNGGGIVNMATLTLVGTNVTANEATTAGGPAAAVGGGIYNLAGLVTLRNGSSVAGNSSVSGGGIFNQGGTVIIADTSTVTGNTASSMGGGIANQGVPGTFPRSAIVHLSGTSRVARNSALDGGGIRHNAPGGGPVLRHELRWVEPGGRQLLRGRVRDLSLTRAHEWSTAISRLLVPSGWIAIPQPQPRSGVAASPRPRLGSGAVERAMRHRGCLARTAPNRSGN